MMNKPKDNQWWDGRVDGRHLYGRLSAVSPPCLIVAKGCEWMPLCHTESTGLAERHNLPKTVSAGNYETVNAGNYETGKDTHVSMGSTVHSVRPLVRSRGCVVKTVMEIKESAVKIKDNRAC